MPAVYWTALNYCKVDGWLPLWILQQKIILTRGRKIQDHLVRRTLIANKGKNAWHGLATLSASSNSRSMDVEHRKRVPAIEHPVDHPITCKFVPGFSSLSLCCSIQLWDRGWLGLGRCYFKMKSRIMTVDPVAIALGQVLDNASVPRSCCATLFWFKHACNSMTQFLCLQRHHKPIAGLSASPRLYAITSHNAYLKNNLTLQDIVTIKG